MYTSIILDESGLDNQASLWWYGYGLFGKPPACHKVLTRSERVSSITFMSMADILDYRIIWYSKLSMVLLKNPTTTSNAIQKHKS